MDALYLTKQKITDKVQELLYMNLDDLDNEMATAVLATALVVHLDTIHDPQTTKTAP
jgi:hypothetical protein